MKQTTIPHTRPENGFDKARMVRIGLVAVLLVCVHALSVLGTLWVLNHPGPAELFRHQPLWGLGGPSALLLLLAAAALTLLLVRERADDRRRARDPRHSGELTLDRVTRLPNHNAILTILDNEWQNCRLNQFPLTIALIQIDHWEQINRDYGYKNGDRCLAAARQRLRKALRRADNLGRLDDGSFLLVLPGVEQQQARLIAERCQESLQVKPVQPGRRRVTLTASLGLCCGAASVQETPEDMLRKAYSALQSARETGGDRAIVYGAPIEPGLAVSEMSFA